MSGRWWRAYSSARHNPKLLRLPDKMFRWWFNLVCVASENNGKLPSHADLAAEFRVPDKVMTEALDALVEARLFDHDETGIHAHDWNTHQYQSDVSTTRVKRFRERQGNGERNVSVTPSESEADTEQIQTQTIAPAPKAKLLTSEWEPTIEETKVLRAELSWINDELWASRMTAFRDWCDANATRTFNPAATWRGFMRQTRKPFEGKQWSKASDVSLMPPAEDWGPRMRGWRQSKFWHARDWGPPPGQSGCRVPSHLLGDA